jgi:hypothetical protein
MRLDVTIEDPVKYPVETDQLNYSPKKDFTVKFVFSFGLTMVWHKEVSRVLEVLSSCCQKPVFIAKEEASWVCPACEAPHLKPGRLPWIYPVDISKATRFDQELENLLSSYIDVLNAARILNETKERINQVLQAVWLIRLNREESWGQKPFQAQDKLTRESLQIFKDICKNASGEL